MKAFFLILFGILFVLALTLSLVSCGTTRAERVELYEVGAVISGHPEAVPAIAMIDKLIPAKQPRVRLLP